MKAEMQRRLRHEFESWLAQQTPEVKEAWADVPVIE
jgi:hypothetical protein